MQHVNEDQDLFFRRCNRISELILNQYGISNFFQITDTWSAWSNRRPKRSCINTLVTIVGSCRIYLLRTKNLSRRKLKSEEYDFLVHKNLWKTEDLCRNRMHALIFVRDWTETSCKILKKGEKNFTKSCCIGLLIRYWLFSIYNLKN